MPLRLVFFGTPAFARSSLEHLIASPHEIAAVVTQPDRPRGRGQKVQPSAVKACALEHGLTVLQPERLKDADFRAAIEASDADLGVVAAYGKLLPPWLLALPRLGMVNVHASLLPRWRGAAPIHRAIMAGDQQTGITIMRVVAALDAGPMLSRGAVSIDAHETSVELERRLAEVGAALLVQTVEDLTAGRVIEQPQDESAVTYAARLERSDGQVDWHRPAAAIHNQIRGVQPWPLAAVGLHGRRLLLIRSAVAHDGLLTAAPGTIVEVHRDAIDVAAAPGVVRLTVLQMEGRPPMPVQAFLNGHPIVAGERLEPLAARS